MSTVLLGDTVRLTVSFRDWSSSSETGSYVNPTSVNGFILDKDMVTLSTFSPTNVSLGTYRYDWTPSVVGTYNIKFVGTFADGTTDTVLELFEVKSTGYTSTFATKTIGDTDQYLYFMPALSPVYLDPDEILAIYPDASPIEVNEFIYIYSAETDAILGGATVAKTTTAYEYIKAATLCSLSKIYDLASGDISSITLGDLAVTNRSFPKSRVSRGTASSWCELAAALREELISKSGGVGFKSVLKGDAYVNPIPTRALRRHEN